MNPNRLLVIDDEPGICDFIQDVALNVRFDVRVANTEEVFRRAYFDFSPSVIILDLQMPKTDGIELLRFLAEDGCQAGILLASGVDINVLGAAHRLGAAHGLNMLGMLKKPFDVSRLEILLAKTSKRERTVTQESVAQSIAAGEVVIHYQPKVKLSGGAKPAVESAEALVRLRHRDFGLLMPDEFLPLAKRMGLIHPLTDLVLRKVVEQIKQWDDTGLSIPVAVNLTPELLENLELPDRLDHLFRKYEVPGRNLSVDIAECGALGATERTMEVLTRLRLKDVGLCIDGIEADYSALIDLSRMPFNEVKIGKSLFLKLKEKDEAKTIVCSIVELARNLGLNVCAVGVENEEALAFARYAGCDRAQGNFVSQPLSSAELACLVRERAPLA